MKRLFVLFSFIVLLLTTSHVSAEETLQDVTGGNTIRGITTSGTATGTAKMSWKDGETRMHTVVSGLSAPTGSDFYEGWLVRTSPFDMISTGRFTSMDGVYTNFFSSMQNFSGYQYYVVTVEADDQNNYPASQHILEGNVVLVDDIEHVEPEVVLDSTATPIELSEYQKSLIREIELRLVNVSILQRMALLERVLEYSLRLPSLDIEEPRKTRYAEILEVLVYVLSQNEM